METRILQTKTFLNYTLYNITLICIFLQEKQLAGLGGLNVKDGVRRTMGYILTHEMALKFNWLGKSGGRRVEGEMKQGFGLLRLAAVVISK